MTELRSTTNALTLRKKRPVAETVRAVVTMYNDGLTHKDIADKLGISTSYVNLILVQVRKGEITL